MRRIETVEALEALYGAPVPASLSKVADRVTPLYAHWIAASRFCVLATVGPHGTDASPRGEDGPVALPDGPRRLMIPDWPGNNRLDSLRNIVADGRMSVMFMVSGSRSVVRVNGSGWLTDDETVRRRFARGARLPATVIMVDVGEVYVQCAKAVLRSGLWSRDDSGTVPSTGTILATMSEGAVDGAAYDADYAERVRPNLW